MAKAQAKPELFTAAKLAEQWGISAAKVKKAILELGAQPDQVKGPCNYYSGDTAKKIKKTLG